jgi:type II secretory pathway predicted ATPase ExeA
MYEQFFCLQRRPFSLLPDPDFLYLGRPHRHALTLLDYALLHGTSFALVTGEIGCGKTTLIRHVLERSDRATTFGVIANTHKNMSSMLLWAAQSLGIPTSGMTDADIYQRFCDHLIAEYAAGRRVVLIVDEAQNLGTDALEQLRVLSNINSGRDLLLQTILVGQPELRRIIRAPELEQLAQRIGVQYHIVALRRDETQEYVRHRLQIAGGDASLFDAAAIDLIFVRSKGVPRLVNTLCDTAMVYAFADQRHRIDIDIVTQALQLHGEESSLTGTDSRPQSS